MEENSSKAGQSPAQATQAPQQAAKEQKEAKTASKKPENQASQSDENDEVASDAASESSSDFNKAVEAAVAKVLANMKQPAPSLSQNIDVEKLVTAIKGENINNKQAAHGLTIGQLKEIHEQQKNGSVKMVPANKVSRHMIPAYETGFVHLSIEKEVYDDDKGVKTSSPRNIKLSVEEFERMSRTEKLDPRNRKEKNPEAAFNGYKVVILHDPRVKVQKEANTGEKSSYEETLSEMSLGQLRNEYLKKFREEALLSDEKPYLLKAILTGEQ
jgi:hypothetical protein